MCKDVARRKLKAIDAAKAIDDLRIPPGNIARRLHRYDLATLQTGRTEDMGNNLRTAF